MVNQSDGRASIADTDVAGTEGLLLQTLHQRSPHNGVAHATGLQSLLCPLLLDQHAAKKVQDTCMRSKHMC
jgi:hypothetical protein